MQENVVQLMKIISLLTHSQYNDTLLVYCRDEVMEIIKRQN